MPKPTTYIDILPPNVPDPFEDKEDWRLRGVMTGWVQSEQRDGTKISAPARVCVSGVTRFDDISLGFPEPNATALFINLSFRLHKEAEKNLREAVLKSVPLMSEDVVNIPDKDASDFFERYMGSIVFAFTAIESFANSVIPEDASYISSKGKTLTYNQILKLPIADKVGVVIPHLLRTESPSKHKIWNSFERLRKIRHEIIHLKPSEVSEKSQRAAGIWERLMHSPLPKAYAVAMGLIAGHYERMPPAPQWFDKCPLEDEI